MPQSELPSVADIDAEAVRHGLATSPFELHGALCGWLAGGGANERAWLAPVFADAAMPAPEAGSALDHLRETTAAQLGDRSFEFELLLPDADAPLVERSGALFDWCRGFVGAFGLAAGTASTLSEEGGEALADLAKLAAAQPQDEGDEEDEEALVEIEEFVRVAALLLHGDCVLAREHRQRLN
ncbi:UPF0149 family protein [Lysobacter xanthus]